MPLHPSVIALLAIVETLRPAFTRPTFDKLRPFLLAWLLVPGRRAITTALVAGGLAGQRHHAAWHRIFSQAAWSADEVGRLVLDRLLRLIGPAQVLRVVIDDTLTRRKGPHVFGIASHLDPVRSTRRHRAFAFGHVWVTLSVVVRFPFSSRDWALPILFRLYRSKKETTRNDGAYAKKTQLARQMLDLLHAWMPHQRIEVVGDSAYTCRNVVRGLPENFVVIGAMPLDAALFAQPGPRLPGRAGRPRKKGKRLPSPEQLAEDASVPWQTLEVVVYGRKQTIQYKTQVALWYWVFETRPVRVVVVRTLSGAIAYRAFCCSDPSLSVEHLLTGYASRWSTEVLNRDLKQFLGFGQAPVRSRLAVERLAPLVGLLYTLVVLWYAEAGIGSPYDLLPLRPWYRHKTAPSFEDMLQAARRAARQTGIVDELGGTGLNENLAGRGIPPTRDDGRSRPPHRLWRVPPWANAA